MTNNLKEEIENILCGLVNEVEWCLGGTGAIPVDRNREELALTKAKQELDALINQKEKEAKLSELENVIDEVSRGDWDWDDPDEFYQGFITHRIKQLKEELKGGEQ